MSENFSKCPKNLRQNLTIGLNLKFPAKTLEVVRMSVMLAKSVGFGIDSVLQCKVFCF
jgi:hypothetical protein